MVVNFYYYIVLYRYYGYKNNCDRYVVTSTEHVVSNYREFNDTIKISVLTELDFDFFLLYFNASLML